MQESEYLQSALKSGLSSKASSVYVTLLGAGEALSPKALILKTKLQRQYVYDALEELLDQSLVVRIGTRRRIKYQATSPDSLLQATEKKRLDTLAGVQNLMKLYERSPAGVVEVTRGSVECIESEFKILAEAEKGDFIDIVGGAGMNFVKLFAGRIEEWEELRKEKQIKLRYIGSGEDVEHNRTKSIIENESKAIEGIGDIVNVVIRPGSVSFNIYEPEVLTVRVRSKEAVMSQQALFEVLWSVAK
jgi:sugar-specific transcriptional regulator TrmB